MSIDISGLDKRELLCALYNNARVNGYCYEGRPNPRTVEEAGYDRTKELTLPEAARYLEMSDGGNLVDTDVRGRHLGVDLRGNELDLSEFDREFGSLGGPTIKRLRETGDYSHHELF